MTRLLEGYIVIPAVAKGIPKGDRIFDDTKALPTPPIRGGRYVRTHTMGIRSGVTHKELRVLLKGTTSIIEVVDLHLHAFGIA